MKIISFETLASTSDHASELVQARREKPPFAVISREQSGGRGRSGKSWESPAGGLYLTLVLEGFPSERLTHLPLAAASAVARWVWQRFKIRVTIKWPNDILFGGAKLGGILCESSVQGQSWGPVLIGVGLNLKSAPQVSEQSTIAVQDLVPFSEDALSLAADLAASLAQQLDSDDRGEGFREFGIENGQLWRNEQGQFAVQNGLDSSGRLQLEELGSGVSHSLSSVRQTWRWIYQERSRHPLLALDIGNSLCKLGIFASAMENEPELHRFTLQHQTEAEREALTQRLRALRLPQGWPVHAIAVRDAIVEPLKEWLANSCGLSLRFLPKRGLLLDFGAYRFDEFGIDRLALAEAAHRSFPRQDLIVVSAGTAVTIEVIKAEGIYLGGYILPGIQTKLNSLHLRTARLPLVQLTDFDPHAVAVERLLGQDTRSAMLRGVLRETQFALKGLNEELEKSYPGSSWQIVCTGGDGEFLSGLLQCPYDPHIILKGIKMMTLGG